ncbi:hypothetical protein BC628DRAFT_1391132 [Trametes gibbosa]|nr:hypothetical protein BC628DRAFT_1391132 [Trametes gibbosa]
MIGTCGVPRARAPHVGACVLIAIVKWMALCGTWTSWSDLILVVYTRVLVHDTLDTLNESASTKVLGRPTVSGHNKSSGKEEGAVLY